MYKSTQVVRGNACVVRSFTFYAASRFYARKLKFYAQRVELTFQ